MKITDVPRKRRKRRITHKRNNGYYETSPITYCFDEDGNEIGFYTGLRPDGEINTSTAGRQWSDELLNQLV